MEPYEALRSPMKAYEALRNAMKLYEALGSPMHRTYQTYRTYWTYRIYRTEFHQELIKLYLAVLASFCNEYGKRYR